MNQLLSDYGNGYGSDSDNDDGSKNDNDNDNGLLIPHKVVITSVL